jgi:2-iminobutanoate/2-iminopropanoate deaminase
MNTITTNAALNAIGPSCQAIAHARLVYCSVRLPSIQRLSKKTMKVLEGGIEEQTERVIANLTATLKAAGSDVSKVLKTTVFLRNLEHFRR